MSVYGASGWTHWTWAGTHYCHPNLYFQPESVDEVAQICRKARDQGQTIVVAGAAHSPSRLTMTQGYLLNLDKLNRILNVEDSGKGWVDVRVEAGIRLKQINEEMAKGGLSLQNLGSISEQSVAGVISTGTHGASAYHGLISDQIVELELMNGDGNVVKCSDKDNRDLFRAALLSLGAVGVIVRATLRFVPAFRLEARQKAVEFNDFIEQSPADMVKWFAGAEFHRIWWYPYADKLVLWSANRTTKPLTPPAFSFYGTRIGRFIYETLLWVASAIYPALTPKVERWLFRNQFRSEVVQVARSDQAINMDCLFSQFVNEWAMPLREGQRVIQELRREINRGAFYVHSPIEIRVSNTTLPQQDYAPSSGVPGIKGPVHGNLSRPYLDPSPDLKWAPFDKLSIDQLTLNLNATIYRPFGTNTTHDTWFNVVERVCGSAGGRPHWAKNFSERDMPRLYGRALEQWQAQARKFDPNGIFGNRDWLHEHGLL